MQSILGCRSVLTSHTLKCTFCRDKTAPRTRTSKDADPELRRVIPAAAAQRSKVRKWEPKRVCLISGGVQEVAAALLPSLRGGGEGRLRPHPR